MMLKRKGKHLGIGLEGPWGHEAMCLYVQIYNLTVSQSCQLLLPFYLVPVHSKFVLSSWKRSPFVFFLQIGEISWQISSKAVKSVASWKFGSELRTKADLNISLGYFHRRLFHNLSSPLFLNT